jgi:hypothetical protein
VGYSREIKCSPWPQQCEAIPPHTVQVRKRGVTHQDYCYMQRQRDRWWPRLWESCSCDSSVVWNWWLTFSLRILLPLE